MNTEQQKEAIERDLMMAFRKKHYWHAYQNHCELCGREDGEKYPYCLPYAASKVVYSLLLKRRQELESLIERVNGVIKSVEEVTGDGLITTDMKNFGLICLKDVASLLKELLPPNTK